MITNSKNQIPNVADYVTMVLLLAVTGFPFFTYQPFWILGIGYVTFILIKRKQINTIDLRFIATYIILFLFLITFQAVQFSFFALKSWIGIIIKATFAFFGVMQLQDRFVKTFVRVMVILASVSLAIWIPNVLIGESFESFFITNVASYFRSPFYDPSAYYAEPPHMFIYTFKSYLPGQRIPRNSGPFWEPAAFSGILILAIFFNHIEKSKKFTTNFLILSIAILSTLSTTGYIAYFIFLTGILIITTKNLILKVSLIPALLLLSVFAFNEIPFLKQKITHQMNETNRYTGTRFLNAKRDLLDFKENPITGKGQVTDIRFENTYNRRLIHRNNGITDFLVKWGILGFAVFFGFIFYSVYRICLYYNANVLFAILFMILLFTIGFSQVWFSRIFFISLFFWHQAYTPRFYVISNNNTKP